MILEQLNALAAEGRIRPLDYQMAAVLADAGERDAAVLLGAALASRGLADGNVCADLSALAGRPLFDGADTAGARRSATAPDLADWLSALGASEFVSDGSVPAPLVLDGARLYLGRYHDFEKTLAAWIGERLARREAFALDADQAALRAELERLFPPDPDGAADDQRAAAAVAALQGFCVISGGPGTGKTTTVTRILALLLRLLGPMRIVLAAPTGKAAARLGESLRERRGQLDLPADLAEYIPGEVLTLHRLLGLRGEGSRPRYHRENPLHCDLLVVDEASMVDLPLMTRLVQALPPAARLILLGDKDQLASVEAGSVLGDICDSGREHAYGEGQSRLLEAVCGRSEPADPAARPMADSIAVLRHSFRFDQRSGIGCLARAVNGGDAETALRCLAHASVSALQWLDFGPGAGLESVVTLAADAYADYAAAADVASALDGFARFRLLCALREGPYGVAALNRAVERELGRRGLLQPDQPFYRGRPLMITRNDYGLKLFNGDVGLVWPDASAGGALRAFFQMPDGSLRGHAVSRLPEHETVFAMTVHKSQGSEFDRVLLLLPPEPSPVVTRELLYTGVTRARTQVALCATEPALRRAATQRIERVSGLRPALWEAV